jgi:iron(III) transport system substrate-binding protein
MMHPFRRKSAVSYPFRHPMLALIALWCLWHQPQWVWSQSADTAKLIAGAKKEGELVLYGTTDLRQATLLNDKFHEKYPFIEVKLNRLTSDNLYPRIIAETRSGKFLSDVLQNTTLGMYFLKRGKFLDRYLSPEDHFYAKEFKDQGYWTTSSINVHVIGYNTRAIARDKLPKKWEDLLNPTWTGRMQLSPREQWFAWILQIMGEEKGLNYMRALAKQSVAIRREPTAMRAQLLTAGESDLDIDTTYSVLNPLIKKGAPINWTTLGPALAVPTGHGMAAHAPHPNAAKLFIDFVLSKEGQRVVLTYDRNSARSDLTEEQSAMKDVKLIPLDPSQGEHVEFYARQAQEIFGR